MNGNQQMCNKCLGEGTRVSGTRKLEGNFFKLVKCNNCSGTGSTSAIMNSAFRNNIGFVNEYA